MGTLVFYGFLRNGHYFLLSLSFVSSGIRRKTRGENAGLGLLSLLFELASPTSMLMVLARPASV